MDDGDITTTNRQILAMIQDLVSALVGGWRRFEGAKDVCHTGKNCILLTFAVSYILFICFSGDAILKLFNENKLRIRDLERLSKEFIVRGNLFDKDCNNGSNDGVLKLLEKKIQQMLPQKEDGDSSGDDKEDQDSSTSPRVFHKFSPLCAMKIIIQCPVCKQPYESVRGLKDHVRKNHGADHIDPNWKEPVGSCKLPSKGNPDEECGVKITTAGANKHLKTHNVEIPAGKFLRGWNLQEDGRFKAVLLRKDEKDPDCDYQIELEVENDSDDDRIQQKKLDVSRALFSDHQDQEDLNLSEISSLVSGDISNDSSLLLHGFTSDQSPVFQVSDAALKKKTSTEETAVLAKLGFHDLVLEAKEDVEVNDREDAEKAKELEGAEESKKEKSKELMKSPSYIEDEFCSDNDEEASNKEESEKPEESPSDFEEEGVQVEPEKEKTIDIPDLVEEDDLDSDVDSEDSEQFTQARMSRKKLRHQKRDQDSGTPIERLPENEIVISEFKEYLTKRTVKTANKDNCVKKPLSYLFYYPDSLLKYEKSKDESFSLLRNIKFQSEDFLCVKYPLNWIQTTDNPARSYEMLKYHKMYREFLSYKLVMTDFGGSDEAMLRKRNIQDSIQSIADLIKASNLYAQYEDLINRGRIEKENAKLIVNPDHAQKEVDAIAKWNQSKEAKVEMEKFDSMYQEARKNKTVGPRKFASFGQFLKFNMAKGDKNRAGLYYGLKVKQYKARTPLWYPDGYSGFGKLPTGWNIHSPEYEGQEPTHYNIRFSGGELKNKGQSVGSITISKQTFELAERYRDLRGYLNLTEEPEDFFFVNARNEPLSDNSNVKGSIWSKCSDVTGVKTNSTMIRRAVETPIQENPEMCSQLKNLNNHGKAVGDKHYHKTRYATRTEFVNARAVAEGETTASPMKLRDNDEVLNERMKRTEMDAASSKAQAEAVLNDNKNKRNFTLSKKCRVLPHDREYLQTLIDSAHHLEINVATRGKFPGIFSPQLNQNEY